MGLSAALLASCISAGPLASAKECGSGIHICSDRLARLSCRYSSQYAGGARLDTLAWSNFSRRKQTNTNFSKGARCQARTDGGGNNVDIWLGRMAMLGFVSALAVEIVTGKGVLQNAGVTTPAPTLALSLVAVVGGITAFGVFRSASPE